MVTQIKRAANDIFGIPVLRTIFKDERFILFVRLVVLGLFFYGIYLGFAYPTKENTFTPALFWGLFWPLFIVVTLPTFGRIFCGICPHGFLGKYITRFGLKKKIPSWLANRYIGLFLLVFGYWGTYYVAPQTFRTPLGSALLFGTMTLVALVFYFLFKDMAYCKYICPIGTLLRGFSKLSFTFFGSYRDECASCKDFACAKSCPYGLSPFNFDKKHNMSDCTLCMECAHSCEAIRYRFTVPGYAIYQKFKGLSAEVWGFILILAAIPVTMAFHHGLGRSKIAHEFIWYKSAEYFAPMLGVKTQTLVGFFAYFYALVLTVFFAVGGLWIASKILKKDFKEVFTTLGYAFAPIFILASAAHALHFFFVRNYERIVEGLAWGFGLSVDVAPLADRNAAWLEIFHYFRWIAVAWAFYILYKRFAYIDAQKAKKILAYPFAAAVILFFIGVNIYRGYILDTYGRMERHHGASHQTAHQVHKPEKNGVK